MMIALRAFQVINQDGAHTLAATYNEVNENGEVTKRNAKTSFYAMDAEVLEHINALETYLNDRIEESK